MVIRNHLFRKLLIGYSLSVGVDSIIFMTLLKWLEMKSGSQSLFTLFYICFYIPAALFSFPIGTWVEKQTLQRVMKYSGMVRIALIPFAIIGIKEEWLVWLFIYAALESAISLFFLPAGDTLLPKLVEKQHRAEANSYMKMSFILMHTVGYMIAGLFIKINLSFVYIFLLCAGLLLLSVWFIHRIRPLIKQKETSETFSTMFHGGISYLKQQKNLRTLILLLAGAWVIASSIDLVIIAYLTSVAKVGTENFSFIAAATLAGMMIGAISAPACYYKWERKWFFILPVFIYAVSVQSLNMSDNWLILLPFFFLGGIVLGVFEVFFTTFLQDETDPAFLARIFSIHTMILNAGPLFGFVFMGLVMEMYNISIVVHLMSSFLILLGIVAIVIFPKINKGTKEVDETTETAITLKA